VTWPQIVGVAALAGIGFTMSLFVSDLAYFSDVFIGQAKVGILVGSVIAGLTGFLLLSVFLPRPMPSPPVAPSLPASPA
jgi:NhaA family Na+:H+ antiporter